MPAMRNLENQRFDRLIAISPSERRGKGGFVYWDCKCDSGTETTASSRDLISGDKKSCGCLNKEPTRKTHGESHTRLYHIWRSMKDRCSRRNNKRYADYGGRGITVCPEWENGFEAFRDWAMANGYRDDLTLDREDNDKGYSPDNCRWATQEQQQNNRRPRKFKEGAKA